MNRSTPLLCLAFLTSAAGAPGCASTRFEVAVPERPDVIKRVKLVIEQVPLEARPGEIADTPMTLEITDPRGEGPTSILPDGRGLSVKYGEEPVVALFASGDRVTFTPPRDLPEHDPRRLLFRVEVRTSAGHDRATCAPLPPPDPDRWTFALKTNTIRRICALTETHPAGQPCAAEAIVAPGPPVATVRILELGRDAPTPALELQSCASGSF